MIGPIVRPMEMAMLIGNLIKNEEGYRILLLVEGQWRDVGINCGSFVEAMDVADRSLDQLYVNLPIEQLPQDFHSQAA